MSLRDSIITSINLLYIPRNGCEVRIELVIYVFILFSVIQTGVPWLLSHILRQIHCFISINSPC